MRKTLEVKIEEEGRDRGKVFHITEMPCSQAEDWAMRALVILARYGFSVPDRYTGMAGIAAVGPQQFTGAGIGIPEIRELMAEMMTCVKICPDPKGHASIDRDLIEDDVEEIATRLKLRLETFQLHVGFSFAELYQKWSLAKNSPETSPATQV